MPRRSLPRARRFARRAVLGAGLGLRRALPGERVDPDFLIVGAQRSGTTSLWEALIGHPQVLPPVTVPLIGNVKGVHYFDQAFTNSWGWYRAHFPTARAVEIAGGAKVGEGSPYYLFHPAIPARIAAALPEVRLIAVLREPVARAYSHYQHMVWEGHETLASFDAAVDAEPERLAGEEERLLADPSYRSYSHQHHSYVSRGLYAHQLDRLYASVPPERVLVVCAEELFADPPSVLREVCRFLDVPPLDNPGLPKSNSTATGPRIDDATRARLIEHFAGPNRELAELIGRAWPWPDQP